MTFEQARNAIVSGLEAHIGHQVNLSEQIADMPEYPYCYYSVLAPRISKHSFGLREVLDTKDGKKLLRSEPVMATMSFTFCSMNRENGDGYVLGEDEALTLAEKAHGFFLLSAHNIPTEFGEVVINDVGTVANRTGFLVEDSVRRYGFDVKFAYVRTDEIQTNTILKVNSVGEAKS